MFQIPLYPDRTAFFLDFDGTLADIAPEPDQAIIRPDALKALVRLQAVADGALAVVSGRSIEQLDRLLFPLHVPLAGVHGAERRDASGKMLRAATDPALEMRLIADIAAFVQAHPGLLYEAKPGAVALHFRQRPELKARCHAFAAGLVASDPHIRLVEGKKVVELKLSARTKGDAIAEFMQEAPFAGRRPFFAGDDATDEAGFAVINGLDGISLKVGSGPSIAGHRVATIRDLIACLERAGQAAPASLSPRTGT